MIVFGNTQGLSPSETHALERLYRRRVPPDQLATPELTRALSDVSHATGRQVGVLISRAGAVESVIVGDATKLMLPDLGRLRVASGRFRGVRLVHTHLRREPLTRDDLVDLTRLRHLVPRSCARTGPRAGAVRALRAPRKARKAALPSGRRSRYSVDLNPAQLSGPRGEFARAARRRRVVAKDGRASGASAQRARAARFASSTS